MRDPADRDSRFTWLDFTGVLKDAGVTISMDGRTRCMDTIFIKRLWGSLKDKAVHLHALTDGFHAELVIAAGIAFSDGERAHPADCVAEVFDIASGDPRCQAA